MINTRQAIMVRPSEDTPKGRLWLSKLDMILRTPYSHTSKYFIYENKPSSTYFDTNIFIKALSDVLIPFYPLAGRQKINVTNNRCEIDCNAKGVVFVEANTTLTLADLGDCRPSAKLKKLLTPPYDYDVHEDISKMPLEMLQFTRFKCGGIALRFASHHHVADGTSHAHFLYSLCRVAKGLPVVDYPIHDRIIHMSPRRPLRVKFSHSEFDPLLPSFQPLGSLSGECVTVQLIFKLSKINIAILKQQVISQIVPNLTEKPSTYEVLAAHIWRSSCKARNLPHDQEVKLYIPIDGRSKFKNPPLPKGYFGNILVFSYCTLNVRDIISNPLSYIVNKIHDAIKMMGSEEYVRSGIDYLESKPGQPDPLIGAQKSMYPNLMVNSWGKLPFDKADFGLGPPKYCGNCEVKLEGLSFLVTSPIGDGNISLAINLLLNICLCLRSICMISFV